MNSNSVRLTPSGASPLGSPRLTRKNSGSSKGSKSRTRSEEKMSLMDAFAQSDEEVAGDGQDDVFVDGKRCANNSSVHSCHSSIKNVDLLHVPCVNRINSASSEGSLNSVAFEMDKNSSNAVDHSPCSNPTQPLLITDKNATPLAVKANCNGGLNHSPASMNGTVVRGNAGEQTPLLFTPNSDVHTQQLANRGKTWQNNPLFKKNVSSSDICDDGTKQKSFSRTGSMYSRLDGKKYSPSVTMCFHYQVSTKVDRLRRPSKRVFLLTEAHEWTKGYPYPDRERTGPFPGNQKKKRKTTCFSSVYTCIYKLSFFMKKVEILNHFLNASKTGVIILALKRLKLSRLPVIIFIGHKSVQRY